MWGLGVWLWQTMVFCFVAAGQQTNLYDPPVIIAQPATAACYLGQNVNLQVEASGYPPLYYQWFFNGVAVAGATNRAFSLFSFTKANVGTYYVQVSNRWGQAVATNFALHLTPVLQLGWLAAQDYPVPISTTNAVAVAAGSYHALALKADGTVVAWGDNQYGQCSVPPGLSQVTAIAAGERHCLALREDGTLVAWGDDSFSQGSVPDGLRDVAAIAAGSRHNVALRRDGSLVAWGDHYYGQCDVPARYGRIVAVAAAAMHSLALQDDGRILAWGNQWWNRHALPSEITNLIAVAAGSMHILGLTANGSVVSWGRTANLPETFTNAVAVAAGDLSSVVLKRDGTISAWGENIYGQTSSPSFPSGVRHFWGISACSQNILALVGDGSPAVVNVVAPVFAYSGHNVRLQALTTGDRTHFYEWQLNGVALPGATSAVLPLDSVTSAQSGQYTIKVRDSGGRITQRHHHLQVVDSKPILRPGSFTTNVSWGQTLRLQVEITGSVPFAYQWFFEDHPLSGATNLFLDLPSLSPAEAGRYRIIATNAFGNTFQETTVIVSNALANVAAWGLNNYGQAHVPGYLTNAVAVAAGDGFDVALKNDGTVLGWGDSPRFSLQSLSTLSNVAAVAAGTSHVLALLQDGTLAALGMSGSQATIIPPGVSNVTNIACGLYHNLALLRNGKVMAWGYNASGQATVPEDLNHVVSIAGGAEHSVAVLGDGRVVEWGRSTGMPAGLSNIIAVASGPNHVLALTSDGSVVAWGQNDRGQTQVPESLNNVVAIAAGSDHSMALRADGSIVCWGGNGHGQSTPLRGLPPVAGIAGGTAHSMALLGTPPSPRVGIFYPPPPYSGSTVNLRAYIIGRVPAACQWQFEGVDIPAATNLNLMLPNVSSAHSGRYAVIIQDGEGGIHRREATLTVIESPPRLLAQSTDLQIGALQTTQLWVQVTGSLPFYYQWYYEGQPLPGATSAVLELSQPHPLQTGSYFVTISNSFGTITSSNIFFHVSPVAGWGENPYGEATSPRGISNITAIAAGGDFSLALQGDGNIRGWGNNYLGRITPPPQASNLVAIAAGVAHAVGIQSDGTVVHWGGSFRNWTPPTNASPAQAVSAGNDYCLAVRRDGSVVKWGYTSASSLIDTTKLTDVVSVAAGDSHALALRSDGTVRAVGSNERGQTDVPANLTNVMAIAARGDHNLALKTDGTVVAWGRNTDGQTNVPPGLSNVIAIAATAKASCALKADGTVVVWGAASSPSQTHLPPGLSNVVAIAGGQQHFLALLKQAHPIITAVAAFRRYYPGESPRWQVYAQGQAPLTYQWQYNGMDIEGATNAVLELPPLQFADAGVYSVIVSNAFGVARHSNVVVVAESPPQWIWQPPFVSALWEETITLTPLVKGSQPLYYQWYFENSPIEGATNLSLVLPSVTSVHSGKYHLLVSNRFGALLVSNIQVGVSGLLAFGDNRYGQTNVPPTLGRPVAVAAGAGHSMALKPDGTVTVWGDNAWGATNVPAGLTSIVAIAAGTHHCLALREDGTVVGWGQNLYGEATPPPGLDQVVGIAAGRFHSLALTASGEVVQWGYENSFLPNLKPPYGLSNVVALSVRGNNNMALKSDGTLVCWGGGDYLSLYVFAGYEASLSNIVAIAAGANHRLALTAEGRVLAWGLSDIVTNVPQNLSNVVGLVAGDRHNYAIKKDGTAVFWGSSNPYNLLRPVSPPTNINRIVAMCTGGNHDLVLPSVHHRPRLVVGKFGPRRVYAGESARLQVMAAGQGPLRYQWKFQGEDIPGATNNFLQLPHLIAAHSGTYTAHISDAQGFADEEDFPLTVQEGLPILSLQATSVVLAAGQSLYLRPLSPVRGSLPIRMQWYCEGIPVPGATNQELYLRGLQFARTVDFYCTASNYLGVVTSAVIRAGFPPVFSWGYNNKGQTQVPVDLPETMAIAGGAEHSLALLTNGTVVAWGDNTFGQTNVPPGLSEVTAIAAGAWHNLALTAERVVWAWGDNSAGQANVPPDLLQPVAIAAGTAHSVALQADGTVVAWGTNNYQQTDVPANLSNVIAIAARGDHTLALKADGQVVAWGRNNYGQTNVPTDLTNVIAVAAGEDYSLALKADGTVAGWGRNTEGQVKSLPGLSNVVAIAAGESLSLALRVDGTIVKWGYLDPDTYTIPFSLRNVTAIASGRRHHLVLLQRQKHPFFLPPSRPSGAEGMTLSLVAPWPGRVAVETSTNLRDWTLWTELTNTTSRLSLPLPNTGNQQFLRINQ